MGLSIHYRLSLSPEKDVPGLDHLPAHWAVEDARTLAMKMKRRGAFYSVGPLCWDAEARKRATDWLYKLMPGEPRVPVPGQPRRMADVEIRPIEGRAFCIDVGHDCEPLWIGLCRYPATARAYGLDWRVPRGPAWRLRSFSKTQYASLHGWEHFRRCHIAIIDFLAALGPLGFNVKISDGGDYWPRRSERKLRAEIGLMNRLIAGAAGALKDAEGDGNGVQARIFEHPQFARLEAEGGTLLRGGKAGA